MGGIQLSGGDVQLSFVGTQIRKGDIQLSGGDTQLSDFWKVYVVSLLAIGKFRLIWVNSEKINLDKLLVWEGACIISTLFNLLEMQTNHNGNFIIFKKYMWTIGTIRTFAELTNCWFGDLVI